MSYGFSFKDIVMAMRGSENADVAKRDVAKEVAVTVQEPQRESNYRVRFRIHSLQKELTVFGDPSLRYRDMFAYSEEHAVQLLLERYMEFHPSRVEIKEVVKYAKLSNIVYAC